MKLKNITIQGFRSFNEPQTLDLSRNGLHYISGKNLAEPRLGGNGAGKSSVLEALCWVLYGKTSVNIKAGNIKNWKANTQACEVTLDFEKHNNDYCLYRSFKPNKLTLSTNGEKPKAITQEEIEDIVGLNFQSFLFSVFISQFSSKFFDLDPAPKLEVFSQTLNLEKWLAYSDKSKQKREGYEKEINVINTRVEKLQGSLEELKSQDYETKNNEWEEKRKTRLAGEEDYYDKTLIAREEDKKELSKLEKQIEDLQSSISKIQNQINKITKPLDGLEDKIEESSTNIGYKKAELKNVESQLEKLSRVGAVCSECKQKVSKSHMEKERNKLDKQLEIASENLKSSKSIHSELTNEENLILEKESNLENKIKIEDENFQSLKTKTKNYESSISTFGTQIGNSALKIKDIKKETNPYKELFLRAKERKKELVKEIRKGNKNISDLELSIGLHSYWQKAFKQIRLFVINEALGELEIQMNNSLHELGLEGWGIHLAVDRETKSKTISKGFTILIYSPINETLVPFECWSGGEAQRLKMAGTLAMSDFIRSRTGEDWNLEAFDEPTAWLGKEGIEDMLEVLSSRSANNKRPTYIIDHRDFETFGDFDSHIKIVKDKNGSEILL